VHLASRMSLRERFPFLLSLGLVACGPSDLVSAGDEPSAESAACVPNDASTGGPVRALEIGTGAADAFWPSDDGDDAQLVWGAQGGLMIQPVLRLQREAGDPPRVCLEVDLDHEIDGGGDEISKGTLLFLWFTRHDDGLFSPVIDDFLGWDPAGFDGVALTLTARVDGALASGEQRRELRLQAPADARPP